MPLNVRSEVVNELAETLAVRIETSKTSGGSGAGNELQRIEDAMPLSQRMRPLQERVLSRPATGLEADKAFYDELSGDL